MRFLNAYTNRLGNRTSNQDRCLVLEHSDRVLLVVADGMGGHPRGDLAAQVAVETLRRAFLSQRGAITEPGVFLKNAFASAHLQVVDTGRSQQPPIVPRTTCVACLVQGEQAWWAHVGDSRLYLLRGGNTVIRTRDHTPVEELLRSGAIDENQLRTHPLRNSVSRCLGGSIRLPAVSVDHAELKPDDTLLLCSDGFWSAIAEEKLVGIPRYGDLERAVNQLADAAEMASYPQSDNISLVCMRWLSADGSAKRTSATADAPQPRERVAPQSDPLQQAIDDIHRAMLEYAAEMKK
ncbi:MAG: serine/threonine-protein phosphatase [Thiogranum sp.]|nr:serine/threonine-protein phosphatase [Thiogranum sp.]